MDSFPEDFTPQFNQQESEEIALRKTFEEKLTEFKKNVKYERRVMYHQRETENPELANEYIEKMRTFLASDQDLLVEYWESPGGTNWTTSDANFRIQIRSVKKENLRQDILENASFMRKTIMGQLTNKANTARFARMIYNLYEGAMKTVEGELTRRGWQIRILRKYRGINCNKGQVVFEVFPPGSDPDKLSQTLQPGIVPGTTGPVNTNQPSTTTTTTETTTQEESIDVPKSPPTAAVTKVEPENTENFEPLVKITPVKKEELNVMTKEQVAEFLRPTVVRKNSEVPNVAPTSYNPVINTVFHTNPTPAPWEKNKSNNTKKGAPF